MMTLKRHLHVETVPSSSFVKETPLSLKIQGLDGSKDVVQELAFSSGSLAKE